MNQGVAYPNIVMAKILLSGEAPLVVVDMPKVAGAMRDRGYETLELTADQANALKSQHLSSGSPLVDAQAIFVPEKIDRSVPIARLFAVSGRAAGRLRAPDSADAAQMRAVTFALENAAGLETDAGPFHVVLSVGGTKVVAGVRNSVGIYGNASEPLGWNAPIRVAADASPTTRSIAVMGQAVRKAIEASGLYLYDWKEIVEIDISWAGPGFYERGLVRNDKILGFEQDPRDLAALLSDHLAPFFGRKVSVRPG